MLKYWIVLTEDEREELLGIVTKGKATAATITHANVLLAVDAVEHAELRMTSAQTAAAYHVSERTVDNVKRKLAEEDMDAALIRKLRSKPGNVKIDVEAEAKIIAITCTDSPEGHDRWTLRLIAEKAVELEYVESISHVAVDNMLKAMSGQGVVHPVRFLRVRSRDGGRASGLRPPVRPGQAGRVPGRELKAAPGALPRAVADAPGDLLTCDYEYVRKGGGYVFMVFTPLACERHVLVTERRTRLEPATAPMFIAVVMHPEAEVIVLVMDNLNAHSIDSL